MGGPSRLKIVQKLAEEIFGRKPNTSVHPDEVVAAGAAIQADILAGNNKEFLLLDVVPLSLGIETYGGVMSVFIPRNPGFQPSRESSSRLSSTIRRRSMSTYCKGSVTRSI